MSEEGTPLEEEEVPPPGLEVLNKEYGVSYEVPNAMGVVVNVNLKAPRDGQVVDEVMVNTEVIPAELYGISYNATDAFISIRNLPVDSVETPLEFDVTFRPYVAPLPTEGEDAEGVHAA